MSRLAIVRLMRVVLPLHRSFKRARCGAHKFVHALGALTGKKREKKNAPGTCMSLIANKSVHTYRSTRDTHIVNRFFFLQTRHMHADGIRGGGRSACALHEHEIGAARIVKSC